MSYGKMVLTIVPSMMTKEMDIDTKIRPIQRLRDVATILNSVGGRFSVKFSPAPLPNCALHQFGDSLLDRRGHFEERKSRRPHFAVVESRRDIETKGAVSNLEFS